MPGSRQDTVSKMREFQLWRFPLGDYFIQKVTPRSAVSNALQLHYVGAMQVSPILSHSSTFLCKKACKSSTFAHTSCSLFPGNWEPSPLHRNPSLLRTVRSKLSQSKVMFFNIFHLEEKCSSKSRE